ncbi:MAG: Gfo/Idh/MocA family oxidoreductase [Anaerolineae bacterium]|nr:Gfo/Idh/MocA family oxidoreductase [Anaerolineae bacterium]
MGEVVGWGILGPGAIAHRFAAGLERVDGIRLAAVGSRSIERARGFAADHGFERAYGSYAELVADSGVDIVYVATPHSYHRAHTLLCLTHGKGVLCEKPMGVHAGDVQQMVDAARLHGRFLMEAMWTRTLPVIRQVRAWLDEGRIGEVRLLSADFGFRAGWNPSSRLLDRALGGGALLDVGIYVLALASLVFGPHPSEVRASAHLGKTGVDEQTALLLKYPDGALAVLTCAIRTETAHLARIDGTAGSIEIPRFWCAESATLHVRGTDPISTAAPSGYHFEAAEATACVREGRLESDLMPLDESLALAQLMDCVRAQIGLVYPMD